MRNYNAVWCFLVSMALMLSGLVYVVPVMASTEYADTPSLSIQAQVDLEKCWRQILPKIM